MEELTDALILGDVAPDIAADIVRNLDRSDDPKAALSKILVGYARKLERAMPVDPKTVLIVGANGSGKTTTIGKLAKQFSDTGRRVVIGACDTFRAAAAEQLGVWADRAGAQIIKGTDPAAVAYKAVESGLSSGDGSAVLLDTAGRLHNRDDLMNELAKIARVIKKVDANAPSETWLVLDGTAGQNALNQIEYFNKVVPLTGLIVTKMDGTSKGGFLISYAARAAKPLSVAYIGYGEKIGDLVEFSAERYIDRFLDRN